MTYIIYLWNEECNWFELTVLSIALHWFSCRYQAPARGDRLPHGVTHQKTQVQYVEHQGTVHYVQYLLVLKNYVDWVSKLDCGLCVCSCRVKALYSHQASTTEQLDFIPVSKSTRNIFIYSFTTLMHSKIPSDWQVIVTNFVLTVNTQ